MLQWLSRVVPVRWLLPLVLLVGAVLVVAGILPATKNIPMLSNQRLLPIPLMNPPVSVDRSLGAPLFV